MGASGTYIREADGPMFLLYSPAYWNDANYAVSRDGGRRHEFRILTADDPAYRPEMETLSPGEYQEV